MPAESDKQRKYIFHLRGKYKTKSKTPAKDKWIWEKGWNHVKGESMMGSMFQRSMFTEEATMDTKDMWRLDATLYTMLLSWLHLDTTAKGSPDWKFIMNRIRDYVKRRYDFDDMDKLLGDFWNLNKS